METLSAESIARLASNGINMINIHQLNGAGYWGGKYGYIKNKSLQQCWLILWTLMTVVSHDLLILWYAFESNSYVYHYVCSNGHRTKPWHRRFTLTLKDMDRSKMTKLLHWSNWLLCFFRYQLKPSYFDTYIAQQFRLLYIFCSCKLLS